MHLYFIVFKIHGSNHELLARNLLDPHKELQSQKQTYLLTDISFSFIINRNQLKQLLVFHIEDLLNIMFSNVSKIFGTNLKNKSKLCLYDWICFYIQLWIRRDVFFVEIISVTYFFLVLLRRRHEYWIKFLIKMKQQHNNFTLGI